MFIFLDVAQEIEAFPWSVVEDTSDCLSQALASSALSQEAQDTVPCFVPGNHVLWFFYL